MKTCIKLLTASAFFFVVASFIGCASFSTRIEEVNADGTMRNTVIKARTLFDSKSELSKLKTSHTDKTQSVNLGSVSQESTGSNAFTTLKIVVEGGVNAVK